MKNHLHLISRLGINPLAITPYLPYIETFEKFDSKHPKFAFRPLYKTQVSFYEASSEVVLEKLTAVGGEGFFYSEIESLAAYYTDIFLFRNPIDLLSYVQLNSMKAKNPYFLFISFPRSTFPLEQIQTITSTFFKSKFHCCFQTGPQSDLISIQIAMATAKRDFSILLEGNTYHFLDKKNQKSFSIPSQEISLGQFRKKSGLARIRCVRDTPPKGYNSYNHLLRERHVHQTQ